MARIKNHGQVVANRTFRRRTDALLWEAEQYRRLAFGEFIPPSCSSIPLEVIADNFLDSRRQQVSPHSWITDRDNLRGLPRWFTVLPLGRVGEAEVLACLTEQLERNARSTVLRIRSTLGSLFSYAVRERLINRSPVRGVHMPPGPIRHPEGRETFTANEFSRTLELQYRAHPRLAAVTEFLSLTGLRWSELRALRVGDVTIEPFPMLKVVRAHSEGYPENGTKTGRARSIPLTSRAAQIADSGVNDRDVGAYLFKSPAERQLHSPRFRAQVSWSTTAPAGRTINDLRHYAASTWLRAGIPVNQVAQWLGHANPATTLRVYAHVLGEAQDLAAIQHLNDLEQHRPPEEIEDR